MAEKAPERAKWIDLIDPSPEQLREHVPADLHSTALELLLAPHVHDDEPRPRIDSHDSYLVGVLLVAVAVKDEDRIFFQEVDFVLTLQRLVTVSKTPPGEKPFGASFGGEAGRAGGAAFGEARAVARARGTDVVEHGPVKGDSLLPGAGARRRGSSASSQHFRLHLGTPG